MAVVIDTKIERIQEFFSEAEGFAVAAEKKILDLEKIKATMKDRQDDLDSEILNEIGKFAENMERLSKSLKERAKVKG